MPEPRNNQLDMKHTYSFKAYGDPKHQRNNQDVFNTTQRSTLATDTAYFRGRVAPYNVKHALVDPSHTFTMPNSHETKKELDYMGYTKKARDMSARQWQHKKRETYDYNGTMVLRLPEKRDYFPEIEGDPVVKYYRTKS